MSHSLKILFFSFAIINCLDLFADEPDLPPLPLTPIKDKPHKKSPRKSFRPTAVYDGNILTISSNVDLEHVSVTIAPEVGITMEFQGEIRQSKPLLLFIGDIASFSIQIRAESGQIIQLSIDN